MLRRFSRALVVLALATLPLVVSSNAAADSRIAVVQFRYAVTHTEDGLHAANRLKKLFDKSQKDLDARQEELQRAREDIEQRQAKVLSREALARRTEDWQRRMVELQTLYLDYNKQLQKKDQELMAPIQRKMFEIIARLAKKKGYDVVIDTEATPYVRQDLDITDQVIQMYNSGGAGGDAPTESGGDKPADKPAEGGGDKPAPPAP